MKDYPENWDEIRKQVYKNDDYECQNCGLQGGPDGNATLNAHHIVPRSSGGNDTMSNLVTLCDNCHKKIHPHMRDAPNTTPDTSRVSEATLRKKRKASLSARDKSGSQSTSTEPNPSSNSRRVEEIIRSKGSKQNDNKGNSDRDDESKDNDKPDSYYNRAVEESYGDGDPYGAD